MQFKGIGRRHAVPVPTPRPTRQRGAASRAALVIRNGAGAGRVPDRAGDVLRFETKGLGTVHVHKHSGMQVGERAE